MSNTKKTNLPAMPFYIGDWKKDPGIQVLTREQKMIWFEMLMLMWESAERGYLTINNKPMKNEMLASALNLDNQKLSTTLTSFEDLGLFSRRELDGAIYSRKQVEIIELSEKRKNAGIRGGNPNLVKQRLNKKQTRGLPNTITETVNVNINEIRGNDKGEIKLEDVEKYFEDAGYDKKLGRVFWGYYDSQNWTTGGEHPRKIDNWTSKAFEIINSPKKLKWLMGLEDEINKGNKPRGTIDFAKHERELKIARGEMPDMVSDRVHKQLE